MKTKIRVVCGLPLQRHEGQRQLKGHGAVEGASSGEKGLERDHRRTPEGGPEGPLFLKEQTRSVSISKANIYGGTRKHHFAL